MNCNLILQRGLAITAVTFAVGVPVLHNGQVAAKPDKQPKPRFIFGSRKIIAIDSVTKRFKFKGNNGKPGRTQNQLLNEIYQQETFEVSITPRTELGIKEMRWTTAKQLRAGDHVWHLKKGEDTFIYMERASITKTKPLTFKVKGYISLIQPRPYLSDASVPRRTITHPTFKGIGYLHVPAEGTTKTLVVAEPDKIEFRRLPLLKFTDFAVGQYVTVRLIVHPHGKLEADEVYRDKGRS
jgi:hypothetical protein